MEKDDLSAIWSLVHTEQLLLRRPLAEDGPAMFKIHGDPATNQYNPAGPDPDIATSEEGLRRWRDHWHLWGFGYWTVMLPPSEEVLGFGGVMRLTWRNQDVLNLYYRLTPGAWGQAYATEIARTAVTLAQAHLPAWPIVARTRAANIASQRTAERAGLVRRPNLDTEHLVFALGWLPANDSTNGRE